MFNREVILPKASEVTNLVIAHCNNIRSKISGAAIEALKELFRFLKKALIANLEFAVKEANNSLQLTIQQYPLVNNHYVYMGL